MASNTTKKFLIFLQLLHRDFYIFFKNFTTDAINNGLIFPLMYAFFFAYIQSQLYFETDMLQERTIMFIGNISLLTLVSSYHFTFPLLFDFEGARHVDYEIRTLSPRLVILEKIVFATLATFALILPFFPFCKLLLQNKFDTSNTNWIQLFIILFLGSLCVSAYYFLAICILKNASRINNFWLRFNLPLLLLGGFWTPWYITMKVFPALGIATLANPFLYITEGARQTIVGGSKFLSFPVSVTALICFSLLFTMLTFYFLKNELIIFNQNGCIP